MERLKAKARQIPKHPGVYFFKNARKEVIYVGKAVVLRSRVLQYFTARGNEAQKMEHLRRKMADIGWKVCDSEIDALIEEARLIKKYAPRFNTVFRDDKNYTFVCVTNEKPAGRLLITHQPARYQTCIGPFTDATAIKHTLRMLRPAYPYCTTRPLSLKRPCLQYHLGRCPGICALPETAATAQKNINTIMRILEGGRTGIARKLTEDMGAASKMEDFKKAQEYKTKLDQLETVFAHRMAFSYTRIPQFNEQEDWLLVRRALGQMLDTKKLINRVEGYDISNISGKHAVGSMVVFENGLPKKSDYRKFKIRSGETPDDPRMMAEVLSRRLKHPEWPTPDLILVDGGITQLSAARSVLPPTQLVVGLAKKLEEIYIPERKNPVLAATLGKPFLFFVQRIRNEAHRFAITYHRKLRGKRSLA